MRGLHAYVMGGLVLAETACGVAFTGESAPSETTSGTTTAGASDASAGTATWGRAASGGPAASGVTTGPGATTSGQGGAGAQGGSGQGAGGQPQLTCPSPNTVCCGGEPCALPSMECCAIDQSQTQQSTCVPAGTCPSNQLPIRCDDSEDCGGQICCTTWDGSEHQVIECRATCPPPGVLGNAGTYAMCSFPDGTCPNNGPCNNDCCVGDIGIGYCY